MLVAMHSGRKHTSKTLFKWFAFNQAQFVYSGAESICLLLISHKKTCDVCQ